MLFSIGYVFVSARFLYILAVMLDCTWSFKCTDAPMLPDIAPVTEGAVQHVASKRFEIGGTDLTNLFAQELKKSNPSVNIDISDVERLKEQYACCTEDQLAFDAIESSCQPETHTLPDGQVGYSVMLALFKGSGKHLHCSYYMYLNVQFLSS